LQSTSDDDVDEQLSRRRLPADDDVIPAGDAIASGVVFDCGECLSPTSEAAAARFERRRADFDSGSRSSREEVDDGDAADDATWRWFVDSFSH
jgi:hypothetical protein